jgi:hypothetical protein
MNVTGKILLSISRHITFDDTRNMLVLDEIQASTIERVASQSALIVLGRGADCGNGDGRGGAPPLAPGYDCPPGTNVSIDTYGSNYYVATFPSPNQGKTKQKYITNNGSYTTDGAGSPQVSEQGPGLAMSMSGRPSTRCPTHWSPRSAA